MPKIDLTEKSSQVKEKKTRTVSLIATSRCNLACRYCYEKHSLTDKKTMELSLAKEVISKYMNEEGYDLVEIDFFGGEPFLAFKFIRDVVDWFHTRTWNKQHRFLIGTNGTILDDEIKEWLYRYRNCINVGLSLDGTKTAHDLCRSGSYDLVSKNLPFFINYSPRQPAKMTISAETIPFAADGIIELENKGILFTANLGFEDQWGDETTKKKLLEIYEEQLSRLVDFYSQRPHLYPVNPLLRAIPDYIGIPDYHENEKREIKRFCGAGHEMVVVDTDGKTYACHRFIPWITGKPAPKDGANCQTAWKPEKCSGCQLIHSCPTCAGFNWEIHGDTAIRTTFHCDAYKLEVIASSHIEWNRLKEKLKNIDNLSNDERKNIKMRLDALWVLVENGI